MRYQRTAHNSHLKTNYVNQHGGVGGVSVAAVYRNLHQEPSDQCCLAAGAVGFLLPSKSSHVWGPQAQEPCWGNFYFSYLQPWKLGGVTQNVSAAGGHMTYGNLVVVTPVWSGGPVSVLGVQIFHGPEANKRRAHGSLAGGHE